MHNPIHKPCVLVSLFIFFCLIFSLPALAQNRIIKGKIINDKGEPVKDAQVFIQGVDIKREYKIKTDDNGEYFYMGIPRGIYNIVVRAKGYQPEVMQRVNPPIQEEAVVDFNLVPGDETQKLSIEMSAEELEQLERDIENAEKRREASVEVKADFELGLELAKQGKYDEAIAEYQKALDKDPEQAYIQANMADALSKANRNEEALAAYQKAIALKPDDAAMYTNMGVLLGKMGKTEESTATFKKAADLNPEAAAQNFYNLGATLVNEGKSAEAATAFRQSIAADPEYEEAYFQLGICLSANPKTMEEAVGFLKKYLEMGKNPDQVEVAKQLISALQP